MLPAAATELPLMVTAAALLTLHRMTELPPDVTLVGVALKRFMLGQALTVTVIEA
jgi:hypothetical protein